MVPQEWISGPFQQRIAQNLRLCSRTFIDLLFPWQCVLCGYDDPQLQAPLCAECRTELLNTASQIQAQLCSRCALPVGPFVQFQGGCASCRHHPLGFDRVLTLGFYEGSIRHLCLFLKHERNAWLAHWLSGLVVQALSVQLAALPRETCIVPIPLHWRRSLARGYNQAEALASELSSQLHLELQRSLRRIRSTGNLKEMSAKQRKEAMRGVFQVRTGHVVKERHILLVDDILTTGATCGSAARTLKQAGARHVSVLVLGRDL